MHKYPRWFLEYFFFLVYKNVLVLTLVYFSKCSSQRGTLEWWKIWLKWSLCVCEREREGINEPLIYSPSLGRAPPFSMFTPSLLSLPIIMDTVFLREYQTKPYSHCSTESALNGLVQLTAIKQLIKTGHTTALLESHRCNYTAPDPSVMRAETAGFAYLHDD